MLSRLIKMFTRGFFEPGRSEEKKGPERRRCTTECAPGPHAFLIVLKVERFTEHKKAVLGSHHSTKTKAEFLNALLLRDIRPPQGICPHTCDFCLLVKQLSPPGPGRSLWCGLTINEYLRPLKTFFLNRPNFLNRLTSDLGFRLSSH